MEKCPFCGISDSRISDNDTEELFPDTWWVECNGCHARGPEQFECAGGFDAPKRTADECQEAAVESWNYRAP